MDNIPTRNNNPGDIRNSTTGAYNTYSSPEEGFNALKNDLNIKISGKSKTGITPSSSLAHFASVYAPNSDGNDSAKYASDLASQLGVSTDTPISALANRQDEFARAIAKNEGYHGTQVAGMEASAPEASTIPDNNQPATPIAGKLSVSQFAQKIRDKYNAYQNVDDSTLAQKFIAKYPVYADKVDMSQTTNPAASIASGTQNTTTSGPDTYGAIFKASEGDNPLQAGLKSLGNVPSSLLNLGKSLFGAATHPINTIKGIGNAFAGGVEEGYNALVGEEGAHNKQTETFDALKNVLNDRYGSLKNAQRTATNDPVGFGADVFSILEGGANILDRVGGTTAADLAKNVPETLAGEKGAGFTSDINAGSATNPSPTYEIPTQGKYTGKLDSAVSTVGGPISSGLGNIVSAPAGLGSKILGQSTGVGSEAIKTGFNAATEGGDASKAFTESLRGNTSPEDLVNKARSALGDVVDTRRNNYKQMLSTLKSDTSNIDINPLQSKLDTQLEDFGIKKGSDGKLDFSESTIVRPSDQQDIQSMANDVSNWKNTTPEGIDTLKQRLGNYWEPGSKTGAFSEGLRSTARGMIEKTPGYSDAMKNYSDMSDTIKDIKQSLSLGDKTAVETSFNKLKNALNNDKEFRKSVIEELDKATGGNLIQHIAGQKMSSLAPRGLAKYADIGAGATALSHGIGIMPILGLALTTSPRIVGEIVNALGLGARGTKYVMGYINKFATPAVVAGSAASK